MGEIQLVSIRLFLDTNILVSATFWEGASHTLLLKIFEENVIGFTTNSILHEYRVVLKRDFHLTEQEVDVQVGMLLRSLKIVSTSISVDVIKIDPSDNRVLEGALEAKCHYIVSYDRHLLDLLVFRTMPIIEPEELLKQMK